LPMREGFLQSLHPFPLPSRRKAETAYDSVMRINRRIDNWTQALGVVMLCNAALIAALCIANPTLQLFGLGCFSLWMGIRLWTAGFKPEPAPPSSI